MAMSIVSVLLGLRTTAVSAIKGGWTQWKRHRARKAALDGEDHRDQGAIESLVGRGLLSLAAVGVDGLPGNVELEPFRDWLRDSDNLSDFVRVYVAHIGQQQSASRDAETRLGVQYTRRASHPPADFPDVLKRVVSFIHSSLSASERDQNEESRALVRSTAAAVALPTPSRRRTSAGTEICPWAVSLDLAIVIAPHYRGNRRASDRPFRELSPAGWNVTIDLSMSQPHAAPSPAVGTLFGTRLRASVPSRRDLQRPSPVCIQRNQLVTFRLERSQGEMRGLDVSPARGGRQKLLRPLRSETRAACSRPTGHLYHSRLHHSPSSTSSSASSLGSESWI